ncbi:Flagellar motor switch protein FliN [Buchnera aphidicola (Thelaxes suberi)]|uniref:flagellar motor switch protein FliN n=1 Tax=Buchnera aphidicola TaxID=9 RepID=UPI003463D20A
MDTNQEFDQNKENNKLIENQTDLPENQEELSKDFEKISKKWNEQQNVNNIDKNNNVLNSNISIQNVPMKITIELGSLQMKIKDILKLKHESLLTLDKEIGKPLNILVNNYIIAQGEIVVVENQYGIRITNIINPINNF